MTNSEQDALCVVCDDPRPAATASVSTTRSSPDGVESAVLFASPDAPAPVGSGPSSSDPASSDPVSSTPTLAAPVAVSGGRPPSRTWLWVACTAVVVIVIGAVVLVAVRPTSDTNASAHSTTPSTAVVAIGSGQPPTTTIATPGAGSGSPVGEWQNNDLGSVFILLWEGGVYGCPPVSARSTPDPDLEQFFGAGQCGTWTQDGNTFSIRYDEEFRSVLEDKGIAAPVEGRYDEAADDLVIHRTLVGPTGGPWLFERSA